MTLEAVGAPGRGAQLVIALLAIATAMVAVQFGAAYAKTLFGEVGAPGVAALRVSLSALMLSPLIIGSRRPTRPTKSARLWLWGYGLSLGFMNLIFYLAISRIPLGVAVALEFTGPLALSLVTSRTLKEAVWVIPAAAGVLLFSPLGAAQAHGIDLLGAGLALLAGVLWAAYIVCGQRAGSAFGRGATVMGAFIAAMVAAPVGFAVVGPHLFDPPILLKGLGVAFLASAVPYSLEMVALTRLPARVFSILMSAEPVIAALTAFVLLGERLDTRQAIAVAAIVVASVGAASSARAAPLRDPD
jgi:inner membrane transporter RhtA